MPVFTSSDPIPTWCELREFSIHELPHGTQSTFETRHPRELFICTEGQLELEHDSVRTTLSAGERFEAGGSRPIRVRALAESGLFHATGRWTDVSGAGIFSVRNGAAAGGDPPLVNEKRTPFDNHYHDCDEYWIFLDGRATVASENRIHRVAPGTCVATGMGWHHDVLQCDDERGIRAVWFETALEGRRRAGHLYASCNGVAEPKHDRI